MSNTTTLSNRMSLKVTAEKAIANFKAISSNPKSLNEQVQSARSEMDKALAALNNDMLSEVYDRCLSKDNPVSAFALTNKYTKWTSRVDKNGCIVSTTDRLDLSLFFNYAKDKAMPIVDEHALIDSVKALSAKLEVLVAARLHKEDDCKTEKMQAKCALHKVLTAINVEGVKARPIDAEYLAIVLTKAKSMGKIDNIDPKATMRYLMDVFHVQLNNLKYDFANVKAD